MVADYACLWNETHVLLPQLRPAKHPARIIAGSQRPSVFGTSAKMKFLTVWNNFWLRKGESFKSKFFPAWAG
jgi:hypothetical protein